MEPRIKRWEEEMMMPPAALSLSRSLFLLLLNGPDDVIGERKEEVNAAATIPLPLLNLFCLAT